MRIHAHLKEKMPIASLTLVLKLTGIAVWASQSPTSLFFVERTTNANVVHHDAQIGDDGKIDPRKPVVAYWTVGSVAGPRAKLGFLERRAWGFDIRKMPGDRYLMRLSSHKDIPIQIYQQEDGTVRAETSISGGRAYLHKVFANIQGPLLALLHKSLRRVSACLRWAKVPA